MRIIIYLFILCAVPLVSIGQTSLSTLTDTSCLYRKENGYFLTHGGKYQEGYEAYQRYFENCASDSDSWKEFNGIGAANSFRHENDKNRFAEFREWLKKVLYYNLDDKYYCADVGEIFSTFYWFDDQRGRDYNGSIAVAKFLLETGHCAADSAYFISKIYETRQSQFQYWRDMVKDSLKTPIDTTLPSLEDLGLGILRGQNGVVDRTNEPRFGNLIATRNPFTDILELKYRLDKSAMVRIDVYDLLGRTVYSEGQGYKGEGEHVLTLQSKSWSSGSYYVRLSSPSGEVKTVKVVKE